MFVQGGSVSWPREPSRRGLQAQFPCSPRATSLTAQLLLSGVQRQLWGPLVCSPPSPHPRAALTRVFWVSEVGTPELN